MAQTVIQVENLSKQYRIGGRQESYGSLRESLTNTFSNTISRIKSGQLRAEPETIWALKDVSFEVKQGEVVGIIGRNGAGKSTLLKILSRITKPTKGTARLRGRVGSLLEVGTGFHPELTGRENIYLNGAILGMSRVEIDRKFDEIVDFAEIEQFLDTPVKHFSSGMYVRLAFAVAAHLEPEILLVDEVLAVGDAAFQKKCLGKMGEVAEGGRTVLFVSHNMGAVESLCQRCILLTDGVLDLSSHDVASVVNRYIQSTLWNIRSESRIGELKTEYFKLVDFSIRKKLDDSKLVTLFSKSDDIVVEMVVDVSVRNPSLTFGYALYESTHKNCLWWSFNVDLEAIETHMGQNIFRTSIPGEILNDGSYTIEFLAALHNQKWIMRPGQNSVIINFTVQGGNVGSELLSSTNRPGLLLPVFKWYIE